MGKVLGIIFILSFFSFRLFPQHLNRYNKKGERIGKWVTFSDSAKKLKLFEGKYRKGTAVGTCLYYSLDGVLEKKEIKKFRKLKTTIYYSDGHIRNSGKARIENLSDKIHYYFYGKWKYYDENGNLVKYLYYQKGEIIKTEYVNKNNKTNDSLIFALSKIETDFNKNNIELLDSIKISLFNPARCERLKLKLFKSDSSSFRKTERILNTYGYPAKDVVQESSNIPFYIMSYAPLILREKYLELFKAASGIGSLSPSALAFYIDKIKVAKGEKQIYSTQFYFDKNKNTVYYPCIDPENLNARREAVGLEKL